MLRNHWRRLLRNIQLKANSQKPIANSQCRGQHAPKSGYRSYSRVRATSCTEIDQWVMSYYPGMLINPACAGFGFRWRGTKGCAPLRVLFMIGCYSLLSNISNSFGFKYSFSFPTFSDFKKPFFSNSIK
jgi:hypothetical protein